MMANPLARDLDHVLAQTGQLWEDLRGARVFITGGTGFFGCWLLETFLRANDELNLGASVVVLTRDAVAFRAKANHLAEHPSLTMQQGDVRTFEFPDGDFSHVIHAAVEAGPPRDHRERLLVFDTIVEGTRNTLEFAQRAGARRFLLASTGAIYGRQPANVTHVPEEYSGGPDPLNAALAGAEAKRAAEVMCAIYADKNLAPTIARCFGFVGPYLPLDAHLAAGNFIGNALNGGPIQVNGDGTPQRSYLYAADLAIWLWTILLRGESLRAYNVGSEAAMSIAALAHAVAGCFHPPSMVKIAGTPAADAAPERYVPSTARARRELGLDVTVNFDEALTRTVDWYRRGAGGHHVNR